MAEISEESLLLMEHTRSKLRDILKDKGIYLEADAPLDDLVDAVRTLNETNALQWFFEDSLGSFSNSAIVSLRNFAFQGMTSLEKIRLDNCVILKEGCFNNCTGLKHLYLPKVQQVNASTKGEIIGTAIENLILPEVYTTNSSWFAFQSLKLKRVIMPKNKDLGKQTYEQNTLEILDCSYTNLSGEMFTQGKLHLLILRNVKNIPGLLSTNVFPNIEEIYITQTLLEQLKTATNWSVYADKIKPLEDSKYEPLDWYKDEDWYKQEMSVWE